MLALLHRQPQAIAEEGFHQNDHLAAVGRPVAGFQQGQGHVVIVAAFAAADAGKLSVHCTKRLVDQQESGGKTVMDATRGYAEASYAPFTGP
ncbi:hypothetical protein PFL02_21420 [Pseudomonas fluorescens]|nr:hypothetical protein PFL02_21420 [Pseudomonas fluorescens]